VKYLLPFVRGSVGGVLRRSRVLPLITGAGSGGRTGEEPSSAVEVVESVGDPGVTRRAALFDVMPSCADAAGGGEETGEDSLSMVPR
jgi:hypothetical protein